MRTLLRSLCRRLRRPGGSTPPSRPRWHSVSSTREYEGCPRRYRFGYLDSRPQDRPVPASWRFGSVVHEGLEAAYRHAVEHPDGTPAERMQVATAAVAASWQRHGLGEDAADRRRATWHVTRALAKDAVGVRHARILGVEEAFRSDLSEEAGSSGERVVGFADLVLERSDRTVEVVDHKVTSHRSTPEQLRDDFQLNLYGHLARRRWPAATGIVATHHYPTGPITVSADLDPERMTAAYARVRAAAALIGADTAFVPTPSGRCSHCPWLPSCPEGTAYVAVTTETA
jgi:hypothetical protein